ncbi:LPS assembly protein LptD [Amaricoccus sp.]|uniref:LPS-assembly protein LptD n=1 Tax=Amaricoccus sp. TaxID=1872485 RepID=UPI001B522FF5|nr:LPS assembly protein LptD [Amaricoccus sp.]MBP7242003.1 LPS-assembly protein LptD [Amaricoccus sp.]
MAEQRRALALAAALALALAATGPGAAQEAPFAAPEEPVALVADRVSYDDATGLLVAEGSVEVLYRGIILRAPRIVYDERNDKVSAEGPIVLVDPDTGVLLADRAALTPDLANGLIEGARLLIADQLQIAAVEAQRRDGRFVTLDRVIASSCTVCPGNPTPTWAIRARRVTEDELAQRIYFDNARLEVLGVPVAWLPWLSIPDPRAERASGFLAPIFLNSQIYGAAIKTPYYYVLGPSSDMTITPFVTSQGGFLAEGEYRRRFTRGGIDVGGVLALDDGLEDDIGGDSTRWFLYGNGDYDLGRGFVFDFDASIVSDDVFLKQFDYSDADLLTSTAKITRTRAKDYLRLEGIGFQSLLENEDKRTVPAVLPDLVYRRTLEETLAGGRLAYDVALLGMTRELGQSMVRGTGAIDWRADWTLAMGLRAHATASAALDSYRVWSDADDTNQTTYDGDPLGRATPLAAVELRWPWVRRGASGVDQVIEPIAQVVWSDSLGDTDVPNEDSELPEFSYSNLFALNRFPGRDRLETGLRANLGVQYTRTDPTGWNLGATLGRVLRADDLDQFPTGTGLDGRWSDWVGLLSVGFDWGLSLSNRMLVQSDLDFTRNEFAVQYDGERGRLGASYTYLAEDDSNPFLGPQPETSELALAARYRVHPNWEVRGNWRFDAASGSNVRAGAGITYGNECAEIDLSVSRRYTSSDNLPPATTIGFGVRLAGLGASGSAEWPPRACVGVALR